MQATDSFDSHASGNHMVYSAEGHQMFYPHDMSAYGSPQETFFANPACFSTNTSFSTQPDYASFDEYHQVRHDSSNEFLATPMVSTVPSLMSSMSSVESSPMQSSASQQSIQATVGIPSNQSLPSHASLRMHTGSPARPMYKVGKYQTYSSSRVRNKRTGVACDPCRAKKQKCDGAKRCHQCVTNNIECKYREVEPKSSGNVLDQLARLAATSAETIQDLHQKLDDVTSRLRQLEGQLDKMHHRCGRCNTLQPEGADTKNVISPRL
jgi:hypothetical protein